MEDVKRELIALSDEACGRLARRIEDLTDEEYFWEPASEVWTLRPGDDGRLHMQFGLIFDETPPVTTIAWRLTHIIDLLSEERCATWIGLSPEPENLFADGAPATAPVARDLLAAANERWKRYVSAFEGLFERVGPIGRQFADATRMTFILHIIDELIHHAAEVGVLRDLYRARRPADPVTTALLSGDPAAISDLAPGAVEAARAAHPDLVLLAAATARWESVPRLIELGFGIDGRDGRTPLHHAAAAGRTDLVRLLIDRGATVTTRDPVYRATPVEWAEFFDQSAAAALLRTGAG